MMKAKESAQISKARRKLLQQMAEENKHITTQALEQIRKSMHYWIARHSGERINLKAKEITIFDENRHSAQPQNRFILDLLQHLQGLPTKRSARKLKGRIKSS